MSATRKYDSTVARIAGNLLSAFSFDEYSADETIRLTREAVAMARGIVAEVERTELSGTGDAVARTGDRVTG